MAFEMETDDDLAYHEVMRLRNLGLPVSATRFGGFLADRVVHVSRVLEQGFARGGWDFTRLLETTDHVFQADFVGIDEINDLSPLQIRICSRSVGGKVLFVGDLDQAIYGFNGVDIDQIRNIPVDTVDVREESFRLTKPVASLAETIIKRCARPSPGVIKTRKQGEEVARVANFEQVCRTLNTKGRTLILGRTNHILASAREIAIKAGTNIIRTEQDRDLDNLRKLRISPPETITAHYAGALTGPWLPRDYYWRSRGKTGFKDSIEAKGYMTWRDFYANFANEKMKAFLEGEEYGMMGKYSFVKGSLDPKKPAVEFCTFHASKGLEEEHAVVLTDSSKRVEENRLIEPDEERRLAYVAATRAVAKLTISSIGKREQSRVML